MISRPSTIYWLLALAGVSIPWWFNLQYFAGGGGIAPAAFFGAAFANPLTTAITLDVYLAALTFSVWAVCDARRHGTGHAWACVVACFAVGLSFALPLYLALRERRRAAMGLQPA